VDAVYDGKLAEVLRPITTDKSAMPFGMEIRDDIKVALMDAFFLNKLNLPPVDTKTMTAYEAQQRVSEFIRQALPLFEPLEQDYNGAVCERTFDVLMRNGAFGPVDSIPESLSGADIQFRFESPLTEAVERQKATVFMEAKGLIAEAAAIDPTAVEVVKAPQALREALMGIGLPARNMRSEEEVEQRAAASAQAAQAQQVLGQLAQGAEVAKTAGEAAKAFEAA
jgi:hypothetical protein